MYASLSRGGLSKRHRRCFPKSRAETRQLAQSEVLGTLYHSWEHALALPLTKSLSFYIILSIFLHSHNWSGQFTNIRFLKILQTRATNGYTDYHSIIGITTMVNLVLWELLIPLGYVRLESTLHLHFDFWRPLLSNSLYITGSFESQHVDFDQLPTAYTKLDVTLLENYLGCEFSRRRRYNVASSFQRATNTAVLLRRTGCSSTILALVSV